MIKILNSSIAKILNHNPHAASLTLGALAFAAGCTGAASEAPRDYAIPDQLCGVHIERDDYTPLFPTGKQVEQETMLDPENGESLCVIRVDGTMAFELNTTRMEQGTGVQGVIADRNYILNMGDSEPLENSRYEVRIWPNQAIAYTECTHSNFGSTGLGISIYVSEHNRGDHSAILKKIITPYIEGRIAQIDPAYCTAD